jgi:hypothetical protein
MIPPILSPPMFTHDGGCITLNDAVNFVSLLSAICKHLLMSKNTQQYFVMIAQEMQREVVANCRGFSTPCAEDFRSFMVHYWPTFRSIGSEPGKVLWGRVSKQENSLHEVGISNSLITVAEVVSCSFSWML